ncbi:NtaA/DmoA family FMN-dependent monooxygenase [uncultured Amnibacterium sp.]|uniref:NtaA/DmoA family FMN-dependent monooxygenase n=1 Tax=uncultured Amnibacterium sp. TaxID=1631851 RepID=UPI0035CA860C
MTGKRLLLNLFEMGTPTHITHGLWRLPGNDRHRYTDIAYWQELAVALEEGGFDAVFLADVVGAYDVFRGGFDDALREGLQLPNIDPLLVIPVMAAVTKRLGFGVTFSTSYEPPFAFARRMSTLDHLTRGRVGWNVVTSYLPNAARSFGLTEEIPHDERYAIAAEYLDVVYKLWEGSWDDDAVQRDAARGVYTDPAKVRRIDHVGPRFSVAGPHLSEPGPQRTPVIFQATASPVGIALAAQHAELVFTIQWGATVHATVQAFRDAAVAAGRERDSLKVLVQSAVFVAGTEAEARAKLETYRAFRSEIGLFVHTSTVFDPTQHAPSTIVADAVAAEGGDLGAVRPLLRGLTVAEYTAAVDEAWTEEFLAVGDPEQVADRIEHWLDVDDVDGINLRQYHSFDTVRDFARYVTPVLRRRGRLPEADDAEGVTLRERLFGRGPRLPDTHPARRYRGGAHLG